MIYDEDEEDDYAEAYWSNLDRQYDEMKDDCIMCSSHTEYLELLARYGTVVNHYVRDDLKQEQQ